MALGSKQGKLFMARKPRHKAPIAPIARRGISKLGYLIIAIIIIAVVAIAYLAVGGSGSGVRTLTANATLSMAPNQSVLLKSSSSAQTVAVEMSNYSSTGCTFLFTETPVLANPVYTFRLTPGQVINLSSSGSGNADLQVKLVSASNGAAEVEFIPIPVSFGVKATLLQSVGTGAQQTVAPTTTTPAANAVTTVGAGTTAATTTAVTTATSSGAYTDAQVMAAASLTGYGILMNNFEALYSRDTGCIESAYNASYYSRFGANATGPNTYANVSLTTPYNITSAVSYVSGSTYTITYNTVSYSSLTTGPALTMQLDMSNGQLTGSGASFKGNIYGGQTLAELNATYHSQASISGLCGAYLPFV